MGEKLYYVCPKCQRVNPFPVSDSKFCPFCGRKLTKNDLKELPICPSSVLRGHCEECQKKKAKACDDCGNTNKVEYRPEYDNKCLCYNCRMSCAAVASLSRSY